MLLFYSSPNIVIYTCELFGVKGCFGCKKHRFNITRLNEIKEKKEIEKKKWSEIVKKSWMDHRFMMERNGFSLSLSLRHQREETKR